MIEPLKKSLQCALTTSISLNSMPDESIPNSKTEISGKVFQNEYERGPCSPIFKYDIRIQFQCIDS